MSQDTIIACFKHIWASSSFTTNKQHNHKNTLKWTNHSNSEDSVYHLYHLDRPSSHSNSNCQDILFPA